MPGDKPTTLAAPVLEERVSRPASLTEPRPTRLWSARPPGLGSHQYPPGLLLWGAGAGSPAAPPAASQGLARAWLRPQRGWHCRAGALLQS